MRQLSGFALCAMLPSCLLGSPIQSRNYPRFAFCHVCHHVYWAPLLEAATLSLSLCALPCCLVHCARRPPLPHCIGMFLSLQRHYSLFYSTVMAWHEYRRLPATEGSLEFDKPYFLACWNRRELRGLVPGRGRVVET